MFVIDDRMMHLHSKVVLIVDALIFKVAKVSASAQTRDRKILEHSDDILVFLAC